MRAKSGSARSAIASAKGESRCGIPIETSVATSSTKDFRDAHWISYAAETVDGKHQFRLQIPQRGYAAMFGEAMFETDKLPYYLSTNVKIASAKGGAAVESKK